MPFAAASEPHGISRLVRAENWTPRQRPDWKAIMVPLAKQMLRGASLSPEADLGEACGRLGTWVTPQRSNFLTQKIQVS
jgi:hypothetical protein